ncbi:MAG: tRNA (adenosine(37)-N6)-dimethylallyltransferase MiaA, partial [Ignavibacteriales bacterium]|nr:tRNA (adenosine(37)-N6)-dimethylallyltransferase MiaA [Ignavibacteriales bacterium]
MYNLITILGPTAVGKTRLAAELAYEFNGEIISGDSRQVYKYMDIGTGKDLDDYKVKNKLIAYHLIDILEPSEEFNLFLFNKYFYEVYDKIIKSEKIPFLVGGTGLYVHSVLKKYDLKETAFSKSRVEELSRMTIEKLQSKLFKINPRLHNTTDLLIKDRIVSAIIIAEKESAKEIESRKPMESLVIGVTNSREKIKQSITNRLKFRLENGMIDEVKNLLKMGVSHDKLEFFGLEYKFLSLYLRGELTYNEMFEKLNIAIHQFSKRQMTWFRKMEREGVQINWITSGDVQTAKTI